MQAAGIHDASSTEDDKAFSEALQRFQETVRDIRSTEEAMKEYLILTHATLESQFRLAEQMDATFAGGVMEDISTRNVESNRRLMNEFNHIKAVYLDTVLHPTNELLRKSMPEIQSLVEKRASLKLDFDSYARRAASSDATKDSAHAQKLVSKRDAAARTLEACTLKIREQLDELEQRRPSMLVSELSSLIGIQLTSAQRQLDVASELIPALPHSAVTMCLLSHGHTLNGGDGEATESANNASISTLPMQNQGVIENNAEYVPA